MLHPVTALSIATAVGSGFFLYAEKHHTAMLDRDIGRVIEATQTARERTSLLRSEWALLNDPDRLQELAGHYLSLQPLAPSQFVQLADLHNHLPDPVTTPAGDGDTPDTAAGDKPADVATATLAPSATAAPPAPAHGAMPPPAGALPRQVARIEAKPRAAPHMAPPHDVVAAIAMPAVARPVHPVSPPSLVSARPSYAIASPYSSQYRARYAAPAEPWNARSSIAASSVPVVTSALGGRPALPPPVPLGADP